MRPTIHRRAAARDDLVDHFVYLTENAGFATAERFLNNAEASFFDLARQPGMGAQLGFRTAALTGIRNWRIRGFDNHLIFYMPKTDGISVVRVLHSATDWWDLLGLNR